MTAVTRTTATIAASVAAMLALASCASSTAEETSEASDTTISAEGPQTVSYTWNRNTAAEDEDAVYEETTVEVPVNPETIVVFDIATLDTIGALGGEVAGAPLDFVPDYLADALAEDAFNAGSLFEADLLEIEAQQPDLIVIAGRSSALFDDLSQIAPTIDTGLAGSYEQTLERNTEFFGQLLGAEDEAEALIAELEQGIADARAIVSEAGTGLGVMVSGGSLSALAPSDDPNNARSARGGLIYDVFGVTPVIDDVASATHGEPISFEFLLEHNPDYLFVVDRDAATGEEGSSPAAEVLDNDIVRQTTAYQEGHVIYLDPIAWYIVFGGPTTTQVMIDDMMQVAG